jgi:hypothetical protein
MGEVARASRRLAQEGFAFMLSSNDCKITMLKDEQSIDFWPNTGLWWVRGNSNKRRGIDNLIEYMKRKEMK